MTNYPYHIFEVTGIELEYMIVDRDTLDVKPIADKVLEAVAGEITGEVEVGPLGWSNELVLHVIELKTPQPVPTLDGLGALFQHDVRRVNEILAPMNARLMPTAMHPWMDPHKEMHLWPHENSPIYEAYNRIFDCRGHGWANLQSAHINLPFQNDEEFGRLHAAIRVLLPLIPALAASSPFHDGKPAGVLDARLNFYRQNQRRIPSITGAVIPEPVFTQADYEREILGRTYRDIAPLDPEGILQDEFLNSRGAIARFYRGSIEIRIIDLQECPAADVAITALIVAVLRALAGDKFAPAAAQRRWAPEPLAAILMDVMTDACDATIENREFLELFGMNGTSETTARELWRHLIARVESDLAPEHVRALDLILTRGSLARRIRRALPNSPSRAEMKKVYGQLCECLENGEMFV